MGRESSRTQCHAMTRHCPHRVPLLNPPGFAPPEARWSRREGGSRLQSLDPALGASWRLSRDQIKINAVEDSGEVAVRTHVPRVPPRAELRALEPGVQAGATAPTLQSVRVGRQGGASLWEPPVLTLAPGKDRPAEGTCRRRRRTSPGPRDPSAWTSAPCAGCDSFPPRTSGLAISHAP